MNEFDFDALDIQEPKVQAVDLFDALEARAKAAGFKSAKDQLDAAMPEIDEVEREAVLSYVVDHCKDYPGVQFCIVMGFIMGAEFGRELERRVS